MKIVAILLILGLTLNSVAQNSPQNYEDLDQQFQNKNFEKCFQLGKEYIQIAKEQNDKIWKARFSVITGEAAYKLKKYKETKILLQNSFEILKDDYNINSYIASILGDTYDKLNDLNNCIDWHEKAFKIEQANNQQIKAFKVANNLAVLLSKKEDYKNSIKWFNKTIEIGGTESDMFSLYINFGKTFSNYGDYSNAKIQLNKAKTIASSSRDSKSESLVSNLLTTLEENELSSETVATKFEEEETEKNEIIFEKAMLANTKSIEEIEQLSEEMQLVEYKFKAQADEYEKEILQQKVKVLEKEKELELTESKLTLSKAELSEEKAIKDKKEAQIIALLIGAIAGVVIMIIFIFSNRTKQKKNRQLTLKNKQIENQKSEIEYKANLIDQSIQYAERIQNAALPSVDEFRTKFKNSFIYFQPKNYVSGDFVWYQEDENFLYLAAVDCTGHGVPGAFMSIICNDILTESFTESKHPLPSHILETSNEKLKKRFAINADGYIKDGMDLALVRINKITGETIFAGARNSIYVVSDKKLKEHKGARRSVSSVDNILHTPKIDFYSNTFNLKKGDIIYLFSDGCADQKGGKNGKKMFYKPFKELILSISKLTLQEQRKQLESKFIQWKGAYEQIDDVTVVGFMF